MTTPQNLHIGQMIKAVFDESGMTVAEFARRIHCERTNVYKIFNRQSVDVEILVKISDALEHNFFEDVMKHYGFETKTVNKLSLNISFDDISDENVTVLAKTIESLKSSKKSCE